jgi:hypothetical protein
MNKLFWLALVFTLVLLVVAGCGPAPAEEIPEEESPEEEVAEPDGVSKLGLGVVTSIARSLDFNEEADILAMAQVDNIIAVASFDQQGRIVGVIIDTAQTRVAFDEEMQVSSDLDAEIRTKVELGADYGMVRASEIGKEWDEQIAALEEWMIGKTVEQVKDLALTEDGAPDDPDLVTSVTITVTDYIAALEKAASNAVDVQPGGASLGLGHNISIGKSVGHRVSNDTEILPIAQVDVVIAAGLFDDTGQIAGVIIDTAQTRVNFDAEGQVTSDRTAVYLTKKELGADYGMVRASEIGKEWDEQIAALEEWMIGKTFDQIKAMGLQESGAPDEPDLVSSVTITVTDYLVALEEAYNRAR